MYKNTFLSILLLLNSLSLFSQEAPVERKNVVRVNLTAPAMFGARAVILGYERVVNKHQTISINIGNPSLPQLLPSFTDSDSLKISGKSTNSGFHFSADYRFYLAKENKYNPPHGLYIGPYYSYNWFNRKNDWRLNTTNFDGFVKTEFDLKVNTVGVELGYQFIIVKRLTLDFILIGPGVGFYNMKVGLDTTLDPDEEALFYDKINDFLGEKLPGYNLVVDSGEFKTKGATSVTSFGFRYIIHLGFNF